jgi:hypothetical protein
MPKYILPFEEYQRGWYEIEADSLEEALAIIDEGDSDAFGEPFYKDGNLDWFPEALEEE